MRTAGFEDAPTQISAAEGYRLWAPTYDSLPNTLTTLERRILSSRLEHINGRVVLDVGCGTGRWMADAAAKGAKTVGVDLSVEMLAVAGSKPQLAGRLIQADGCVLPISDGCVDIVICSFSLGYVDFPELMLHEFGRVARHGGTIMVSDLHPLARLMGWRRSFRSGARVFEIESHSYTSEQLVSCGRRAGLELREIFEPHLSEPERLIMRIAGKEAFFDGLSAIPAVLALIWQRP